MMEAVLQAVDCLPAFWWPMAVAGPQASGRNGRLGLCGVVLAIGPLEAAIANTLHCWFLFGCLLVFVGIDAFRVS